MISNSAVALSDSRIIVGEQLSAVNILSHNVSVTESVEYGFQRERENMLTSPAVSMSTKRRLLKWHV